MSIKLSNKLPSHSGLHKTRLASSEHWDHGLYYLASKNLYQGHWFMYFQGGQTLLDVPDQSFKDRLDHTILALEYHPPLNDPSSYKRLVKAHSFLPNGIPFQRHYFPKVR